MFSVKLKSGLLDVALSIAVAVAVMAFAAAAVAWVSSAIASGDPQADAALVMFAFGATWLVASITGVAIGRLVRTQMLIRGRRPRCSRRASFARSASTVLRSEKQAVQDLPISTY